MPTIVAAVATIQAHPVPVVFLDTCVLLDIIRAPLRNAASAVEAAAELLTGTQHGPPSVHLVIGCPTPKEWSDHVDEVVTDCTTAVNSVNAVSEAWGFLGMAGIPSLPAAAMILPNRLRDLSKVLRDAAILLDKDADALSRAIDRVINVMRPMRKEGKGAKDAVIVEHAIGLTSALRVAGFAQRCVFVSSNTNDFAISKTTTLHPHLAGAFGAPTNLDYAASIPAAVTLLKAGGWVP
jgi:hypothetical protein